MIPPDILLIRKLMSRQNLSRAESAELMEETVRTDAEGWKLLAYSVASQTKGETVEEILGMFDAARRLTGEYDLDLSGRRPMDISTSGGKVRRFYAAWLNPPAFEPGAGDRPRADPSGLAPSQLRDVPNQQALINTIENRNVAPRSQYSDEVNAAIDRVRNQGIGIDSNDPERNRISNFDLYHHAVVMELRRQGFNAAHDGEELAINRPGDAHSEQFDISTWTGDVRRFYKAWLNPPAF